jgi:RNA recognition motif-containing protein
MKILVRNLDRLTTEEELRALFQEFGAVQSCSLVMDRDSGASKGFGFIDMPVSGEAKAAIKKLNSKTVGSNVIRVKKAENKNA